MLLILIVDIHGLSLWKKKKLLQLLMLFKILSVSLDANFTIDFYNRSLKSWLQDNGSNSGFDKKDNIKWVIFQNHVLVTKKKRVKLDFNYTTKSDLKSATGIHTSKFTKDVDLASLKSNVR